MRELPILFTGENVCAILEGRKGQTRRIKKPHCVPGDVLWVRENICCNPEEIYYSADRGDLGWGKINAEQMEWFQDYDFRGRDGGTIPSIHMPRWACRLELVVKEVREERLQDITADDAKAEGCELPKGYEELCKIAGGMKAVFRDLWDSINAKRYDGAYAWKKNPRVWVITFERRK